jgi:1-deoxy-D-xylulose 5-phosphate reductoisomerase
MPTTRGASLIFQAEFERDRLQLLPVSSYHRALAQCRPSAAPSVRAYYIGQP